MLTPCLNDRSFLSETQRFLTVFFQFFFGLEDPENGNCQEPFAGGEDERLGFKTTGEVQSTL